MYCAVYTDLLLFKYLFFCETAESPHQAHRKKVFKLGMSSILQQL